MNTLALLEKFAHRVIASKALALSDLRGVLAIPGRAGQTPLAKASKRTR